MVKDILTSFIEHQDEERLKTELEAYTHMRMASWPAKKWILQVLDAYFRTGTNYRRLYDAVQRMR